MGPPSYMRSVVDRKVVRRRIPVTVSSKVTDHRVLTSLFARFVIQAPDIPPAAPNYNFFYYLRYFYQL